MERDFSSLFSTRELLAYFCVPISQDQQVVQFSYVELYKRR